MITSATDLVPAVDDKNPPASIRRDPETFGPDGEPSGVRDYNSFASWGGNAGSPRRGQGWIGLSRPPLARSGMARHEH